MKFITCEKPNTQLVIATKNDAIYVAFRGTDKASDWVTNLSFPTEAWRNGEGGQVHSGFREAYLAVQPALLAELKRLEDIKPRPIMFTGHSLGGALALLAASDARSQGYKVPAVYSFGAPSVGDHGWARSYASQGLSAVTFRVVNNQDDVTRMGVTHHVGNLVFFNANHDAFLNPPVSVTRGTGTFEDHSMTKYADLMKEAVDKPFQRSDR